MTTVLPPHAPEAERGILGSILQASVSDQYEVAMGAAQEKLGAWEQTPFYVNAHATIWEAMLALDSEDQKPDLVLLVSRLRTLGKLEEIGGATYLADLMDASPSPANIGYYLELVVEAYQHRRALIVAGRLLQRSGEVSDIKEELAKFEAEVISLSDSGEIRDGATPIGVTIPEVVRAIESSIEHRTQGLATGIQSPWGYFNKLTMGFLPRQVTLIGGEASVGKTSFALNITHHVAIHQGIPVGILSAESGKQELTVRLLCIDGRVNGKKVHSGYATEGDLKTLMRSAGRLTPAPIYIDARDEMTPQNIKLRGRRLVRQFGVRLLILDHIHECYAPEARGDMKLEAKLLMAACRWLARTLDIPMIVLSQLNREGQREMAKSARRRPMKSDLRESGYLEQMSDNIGILYRDRREDQEGEENETPEMREAREETWEVGLEMVKQRNGPTGGVALTFHRPTFRFLDRHGNTGAVDAGQRKMERLVEEEMMAEAEEIP